MDEEVVGRINITVTEDNVEYESEFSVNDIIFWMETLKFMMLKKMVDSAPE